MVVFNDLHANSKGIRGKESEKSRWNERETAKDGEGEVRARKD